MFLFSIYRVDQGQSQSLVAILAPGPDQEVEVILGHALDPGVGQGIREVEEEDLILDLTQGQDRGQDLTDQDQGHTGQGPGHHIEGQDLGHHIVDQDPGHPMVAKSMVVVVVDMVEVAAIIAEGIVNVLYSCVVEAAVCNILA